MHAKTALVTAIAIGLAGCGGGSTAVDDATLSAVTASSEEWLTTGRDYHETHFSPAVSIDTSNVSRLGVAWTYDTGTHRGLEATPLVHDGVLYATASWSIVFALDARTGKELWRWDPKVDPLVGQKACCDVVNRGVALYGDKVYVGVIDGRLAALDAKTGAVKWEVQTVDTNQPYTITGAPRVMKGKVVIGNGGAELGVRGYVSAYDAETGAMAWRFYVVPGDPSKPFEHRELEAAAKTWSGDWYKYGGGGTPWDGMAYDPEADLLYVGTGNGSPWNHQTRSNGQGDNLYLSSILALRPETGELAWHYQTTPADNWDYTAVQPLLLTDLTVNGQTRKVIMQAPKNGFFYVLDRLTGELISAEPYSTVTWATHIDKTTGRPVETPLARYGESTTFIVPGPDGAHNWQPMAWNPDTKLVYIPVVRGSFPFARDPRWQYIQGQWNLSVSHTPAVTPEALAKIPPMPSPGALVAWDPVEQKERWRVDHMGQNNGGVLTTHGNLVFQGTADGRFVAYSADKGEKLWEAQLGTGVMAAPATYELDGKQYVTVLAGWGGATAQFGGNYTGTYKTPGRVWTFVLDGSKAEPVQGQPKPELTAIPVDAPKATVDRGAAVYGRWCAMCHGVDASSGGTIADLRYAAPATLANLQKIVLEGAYNAQGMPSFSPHLKPEDVDAIRAYLLTQRAALMAAAK